MRYFFSEKIEKDSLTSVITGSDVKHIKKVMRLKPGDKIGLFDGTGMEYEAKISGITFDSIQVDIINSRKSASESPIDVIVAQGYLKDKKMDIIVRQVTELGVKKWFPFFADRSISEPDKNKLSKRIIRWEKITKESIKQCRRSKIPEIGHPLIFKDALKQSSDCDLKIIFWEKESKYLDHEIADRYKGCSSVFIMLGPEGGFKDSEVDDALDQGFISASLGPRILKAETASIAASVLVQYLFGDMGKKY